MSFFRLILVFLSCLAVLPANASETIPQAAGAYWSDSGGDADIDTAMRADFKPYQRMLALGYLAQPVWVRLRIAAAPDQRSLVLRIAPAFLRELTLYDPAQRRDGRIVPQMSGRIGAIDQASYRSLNPGFDIAATAQARDVYLRIRTPTTMMFQSVVLASADAADQDRLDLSLKMLYVAALLLSCVWSLANFLILREPLYGWFALRQLYSTLYVLCYIGMLRFLFSRYLDPYLQDNIYNAVLALAIGPVLLFEVRLLREFRTSHRLRQICLSVAAVSLVVPVLMLAGLTQTALKLNMLLVLLATIGLLALAFSARRQEGQPLQRLTLLVLRSGYAAMFAMVFFPGVLMRFGLPFDWLFLSTPVAHPAIATVVLMSLLAIRSRQLQLAHQQSLIQQHRMATELSRERAVRQEKQQLISMLIHELKNPLSVVRLLTQGNTASGRAVQQAADDIGQVIESVYQSEKIGDRQRQPVTQPLLLRALLEQARSKQRQPALVVLACDDALEVRSNPELLLAIFCNLLDNALKYSPDGSPVTCVAQPVKDQARHGTTVRISNQPGKAGMPDPAQLFTKYYRSPQAHREIGSGLGLFLVSEWITSLGGSVQFASGVDQEGRAEICFEVFVPQ